MQKSDVKTKKNTLKIEILCKSWHFRYSGIRCFGTCSILRNSVRVNYTESKMKYAYFMSVGLASLDTSWDFL
jgi:hypothetical protein